MKRSIGPSRVVFNAPPGWPVPPPGWMPPLGWTPPPEWPAAPSGWVMFIELGNNEGESSFPTRGGNFHPAYSHPSSRYEPRSALPLAGGSPLDPVRRGLGFRFAALGLFGVFLFALMFLLLGSSTVPFAVTLCEDAVQGEISELQLESNPAEGQGRSDIRMLGTPTAGANDTINIAGDYYSPSGTWVTFTCTVQHKADPPQVVNVTVTPMETVE